jgi:tuftelin-interacting protein 11
LWFLLCRNWDPRTQSAILVLMDTWKPILPHWVYDNVIEQLVYPRITCVLACASPPIVIACVCQPIAASCSTWVNAWSPATDVVPIHQWLQPWIAHLGYRMEQLYPIIRQKLMFALQQWVPADPSAHAILLPWKPVCLTCDA